MASPSVSALGVERGKLGRDEGWRQTPWGKGGDVRLLRIRRSCGAYGPVDGGLRVLSFLLPIDRLVSRGCAAQSQPLSISW